MSISLKFKSKELIFEDWAEVGSVPFINLRRICLSIPGTYIQWAPFYGRDGNYWERDFQGQNEASGLYQLRYLYDKLFLDIKIEINQIKEAQDHMDFFIRKFNSLKAFF